MQHLDLTEIAAYEQRLRTMEQEVASELMAISKNSEPLSLDEPIGRLTRGDAMQDQQMALHLRQRLELQETRIQTALERIEEGTYGVCVVCDEPMDRRRLDLMPEVPACVACLQKRK